MLGLTIQPWIDQLGTQKVPQFLATVIVDQMSCSNLEISSWQTEMFKTVGVEKDTRYMETVLSS